MGTMHVITVDEFQEMLKGNSAVTFQFTKKDNTTRLAVGTLNEKLIPASSLPKDPTKVTTNVNFFDLDKKSWRSLPADCKAVTIIE